MPQGVPHRPGVDGIAVGLHPLCQLLRGQVAAQVKRLQRRKGSRGQKQNRPCGQRAAGAGRAALPPVPGRAGRQKQQNGRRRQPKHSDFIYIAQNISYIFQIVYAPTSQCRRGHPQFQARLGPAGQPGKAPGGYQQHQPHQKHIHGLGRAKGRRQHQQRHGFRRAHRAVGPHHAQAVSGEGKGQPQHQRIRRKAGSLLQTAGQQPHRQQNAPAPPGAAQGKGGQRQIRRQVAQPPRKDQAGKAKPQQPRQQHPKRLGQIQQLHHAARAAHLHGVKQVADAAVLGQGGEHPMVHKGVRRTGLSRYIRLVAVPHPQAALIVVIRLAHQAAGGSIAARKVDVFIRAAQRRRGQRKCDSKRGPGQAERRPQAGRLAPPQQRRRPHNAQGAQQANHQKAFAGPMAGVIRHVLKGGGGVQRLPIRLGKGKALHRPLAAMQANPVLLGEGRNAHVQRVGSVLRGGVGLIKHQPVKCIVQQFGQAAGGGGHRLARAVQQLRGKLPLRHPLVGGKQQAHPVQRLPCLQLQGLVQPGLRVRRGQHLAVFIVYNAVLRPVIGGGAHLRVPPAHRQKADQKQRRQARELLDVPVQNGHRKAPFRFIFVRCSAIRFRRFLCRIALLYSKQGWNTSQPAPLLVRCRTPPQGAQKAPAGQHNGPPAGATIKAGCSGCVFTDHADSAGALSNSERAAQSSPGDDRTRGTSRGHGCPHGCGRSWCRSTPARSGGQTRCRS